MYRNQYIHNVKRCEYENFLIYQFKNSLFLINFGQKIIFVEKKVLKKIFFIVDFCKFKEIFNPVIPGLRLFSNPGLGY